MVKGLKFAVVWAIFLLPFAYPPSALAWSSFELSRGRLVVQRG